MHSHHSALFYIITSLAAYCITCIQVNEHLPSFCHSLDNGIKCTGVYADTGDIKEVLGKKHEKASPAELESKELIDDLKNSDVCMTVRLQIVYGKLSIRSVRSAFEESVGNRLQKFAGSESSDNKELLQRLVIPFSEYSITWLPWIYS